MGSSGSGAADCGVGPIVWVRRRNGSWWPGKILGPDELAECNLTSPRTGTPVKLLGREDASVDWYNLEKSKRVKAFRCGEFDDCIERAESAQGMPIKKREKYARREDAILHALELEKQLLKKQGKLGATSDQPRSKSSGSAKKEPGVGSEGLANNSEKTGNAKVSQHLNRVDSDIKVEIFGNAINAKEGKHSISEDDHSEAMPRMRGLQDFGLKTAPLKRKLPSSVDSDGSEKPMADNDIQTDPVDTPSMERTNHENGVEQMGAVCRAKKSRCIYFPSESNDSLDDKELPTNQNKIFPPQLEDDDGHTHHGSLNEQNSSSGFMEDVESDSSETDSSDSVSDSSETEADVDDEMTGFPDAAISSEAEQDALRQPQAPGEHGSTSSEEADELAFSGEMHHFYPEDPFLANEAVSKWQLKGKRNIRHLTKKSVDRADGKILNVPRHGNYHGIKGSTFGQRAYGFDDADFRRKYFGTQMVGLDNGHYPYAPRFFTKGRNDTGRNIVDWREMMWEDRPAFRGRWEERAEHFNPMIFGRHLLGGRSRSMLIDADLKVQASYQKERVPIVSLMSKLNGKAIIGHPIQIEALEDGSSETLVSINDCHSIEAVDYDGNTSLPPAWRTARRTNFRTPRPHLSSVLGGGDAAEDPIFIDQERRFPFKKSNAGSFSHKASIVRKSLPHISRPPMDRKFIKKLPKKTSLTSNQKTRTLSSIAGQQNFGVKPIHYTSGGQMDGLIKAETSGPTTVACIPIKLVFSRLLEKINRPPSKAACKGVNSNRDAERQSS